MLDALDICDDIFSMERLYYRLFLLQRKCSNIHIRDGGWQEEGSIQRGRYVF